MLDLTRVCPSRALGLLLLASGCAHDAPPAEAPLETTAQTAEAAPEPTEVPATPSEATTAATGPAEPAPAATPAVTPHGIRDARGKAEIQQVMADHRDTVRACYDAALTQNPGIKGDLVIDFVIAPNGDVKQAEVNWSQSELHVPELDACAAKAVLSFKFPASSRGLESKVSYPFNFNPPRTDPASKKP